MKYAIQGYIVYDNGSYNILVSKFSSFVTLSVMIKSNDFFMATKGTPTKGQKWGLESVEAVSKNLPTEKNQKTFNWKERRLLHPEVSVFNK